MIELQNELTYQEFILGLSEKLGFEIDVDSFDNGFLKILYDYSSEYNKKTSDKINSRQFENLTGRNLNEFLSFFNVKRRAGTSNDIFNLEFFMRDDKTIKIKSGSVIEFENKRFEVIRDEYLSNGFGLIRTVQSQNNREFNSPCFTREGSVIFEKESLEIPGETNIEAYVSANLKLNSTFRDYAEIESDFEFLERSKSVMQSFGYSNNKKIELELTKDSRIKDLYFDELNGVTEITVIPYKMEEVDDVIEYSKEVVDYYKGSRVDVVKPTMLELYIDGLQYQLLLHSMYDKLYEAIMNDISILLNSTKERIIYKNEIITAIRSSIYNIDPNASIDLTKVELKYDFYNKNNYSIPMINDEILDKKEYTGGTVVTIKGIR